MSKRRTSRVLATMLAGIGAFSGKPEKTNVKVSKDYNFGPNPPHAVPRERPDNYKEKRKKRRSRKRKRGY